MARPKVIPLPKMPKLPEPPKTMAGLTIRPTLPKVDKPPTFGRGPRSIQPGLQTSMQQWPPQPPDFVGTRPEWLVYWALTRLGYQEGEDFTFQSSQLGARYEAGTAIVDFFLPKRQPPLSLRIQGMFWHYFGPGGSDKRARDLLQRQELEERGIEVVDLDEDVILRDPIHYTNLALQGIDVSLGRREEGA